VNGIVGEEGKEEVWKEEDEVYSRCHTTHMNNRVSPTWLNRLY
jgi:hypothetical protein